MVNIPIKEEGLGDPCEEAPLRFVMWWSPVNGRLP
jgi:hypothetical protein